MPLLLNKSRTQPVCIEFVSFIKFITMDNDQIKAWELPFSEITKLVILSFITTIIARKLKLNKNTLKIVYQTNRFYIFNDKNEAVAKGYYFSGGKILQSDTEEVIRGNSVILNLNIAKDNKEFQL